MPSQEEITNQQELLAAHRRTLAQYLKQQALIGEMFAPPSIANGINEARANIRRLKGILRDWGAPVEDHPDDEELPARPTFPAPARLPLLRVPKTRRVAMLVGALVLLGLAGFIGAILLRQNSTQTTALHSAIAWSQCDVQPAWVLPGTILPAQDPNRAREQLAQAIAEKHIEMWPVAGPDVEALFYRNQPGDPRNLYMTISGVGTDKVDIHLFSKAGVTITTQEIAEHVDVATFRSANILDVPSGCGGGVNRTFSPTDLTRKSNQFTDEREYTGDPFLTLKSESSEVLVFPFECRSPGTYTVQIALRYRDNFRSTSATYLSSELPVIVCPSRFTFWPIMYSPGGPESNKLEVQLGIPKEYFWNGTSYQEGSKP